MVRELAQQDKRPNLGERNYLQELLEYTSNIFWVCETFYMTIVLFIWLIYTCKNEASNKFSKIRYFRVSVSSSLSTARGCYGWIPYLVDCERYVEITIVPVQL